MQFQPHAHAYPNINMSHFMCVQMFGPRLHGQFTTQLEKQP